MSLHPSINLPSAGHAQGMFPPTEAIQQSTQHPRPLKRAREHTNSPQERASIEFTVPTTLFGLPTITPISTMDPKSPLAAVGDLLNQQVKTQQARTDSIRTVITVLEQQRLCLRATAPASFVDDLCTTLAAAAMDFAKQSFHSQSPTSPATPAVTPPSGSFRGLDSSLHAPHRRHPDSAIPSTEIPPVTRPQPTTQPREAGGQAATTKQRVTFAQPASRPAEAQHPRIGQLKGGLPNRSNQPAQRNNNGNNNWASSNADTTWGEPTQQTSEWQTVSHKKGRRKETAPQQPQPQHREPPQRPEPGNRDLRVYLHMPEPEMDEADAHPYRCAGSWALRREVARICGGIPLDDIPNAATVSVGYSIYAKNRAVQTKIMSFKQALIDTGLCSDVTVPQHWHAYLIPRVPLTITVPDLETKSVKTIPSEPYWAEEIQRASGLAPARIDNFNHSVPGAPTGAFGQSTTTTLRVHFLEHPKKKFHLFNESGPAFWRKPKLMEPKQCEICYDWHGVYPCGRDPFCVNCARTIHVCKKTRTDGVCTRDPQCANCRGPHRADDTECPLKPVRKNGSYQRLPAAQKAIHRQLGSENYEAEKLKREKRRAQASPADQSASDSYDTNQTSPRLASVNPGPRRSPSVTPTDQILAESSDESTSSSSSDSIVVASGSDTGHASKRMPPSAQSEQDSDAMDIDSSPQVQAATPKPRRQASQSTFTQAPISPGTAAYFAANPVPEDEDDMPSTGPSSKGKSRSKASRRKEPPTSS
jgi:hypothetical protein